MADTNKEVMARWEREYPNGLPIRVARSIWGDATEPRYDLREEDMRVFDQNHEGMTSEQLLAVVRAANRLSQRMWKKIEELER